MNGFLRCLNSASPSSPFKNLPKILLLILLLNLLLCFLFSFLLVSYYGTFPNFWSFRRMSHSSESGWTMYIGSPIDGSSDADTDEDVEEEEQEEAKKKNKAFYANHQDDSDDSMASDASSGPSHQQRHHFGENERMKNPNGFKNEVSFCLESKTKKPLMEKQRGAERKEVKEKLVLVGQKPKSSVQSSSKVRKSIWMGKRN